MDMKRKICFSFTFAPFGVNGATEQMIDTRFTDTIYMLWQRQTDRQTDERESDRDRKINKEKNKLNFQFLNELNML